MSTLSHNSPQSDSNLNVYVDNQGLISVILPTGNVVILDALKKLNITPNNKQFHFYDTHNQIGFTNKPNIPQITADNTFTALRHRPAPEGEFGNILEGKAITNGDIKTVPILGSVTHYVYPEHRLIINVTNSDHELSPGIVVRHVQEVNGTVYVSTTGIGTGDFPRFNQAGGSLLWGSVDADVAYIANLFGTASVPLDFDKTRKDGGLEFLNFKEDTDQLLELDRSDPNNQKIVLRSEEGHIIRITIGDTNGDGKLDLKSYSEQHTDGTIYEGQGDASIKGSTQLDKLSNIKITIPDLNIIGAKAIDVFGGNLARMLSDDYVESTVNATIAGVVTNQIAVNIFDVGTSVFEGVFNDSFTKGMNILGQNIGGQFAVEGVSGLYALMLTDVASHNTPPLALHH